MKSWRVVSVLTLTVLAALAPWEAQAGCPKVVPITTEWEQIICYGTEFERKTVKGTTYSIGYTATGCEGTTGGSGTGGTTVPQPGSYGGGTGGTGTQTGDGGTVPGSPSTTIEPEDCIVCAGGAGTAGGDNGNPGTPPGDQKDDGCGGDAEANCNQCEPVVNKPGSYAVITNGTYTFDAVDLRVPARGMDVLLRRTYRSNRIIDRGTGPVFAEPADGPFGYGWMTPFTVRIENGDTFVDADGRYFKFKTDAAGNFLTDTRSGLTLKKTASGFELKKLDAFTRTFDAQGKLLTKSDNYGNNWTLRYDGQGRLIGVLDVAGRQALTFAWNAGRIESVTGLASRTVHYAYDGFGNLVTVTDPAGFDSTYTYNTYHGVTSKANPLGETYTIEYRYPDKGIVGKVVDPIGTELIRQGKLAGDHQVVYAYDFNNKVFYVTDKGGRQVKKVVNDKGLLTAEVEVETGKILKKVEYLSNRTEKITDEAGNVTLQQKDEWGNLIRKVDGEGNEWRYTYAVGNRLTSSTDPTGVVSRFEYDGKGNVIKETLAAGTEIEQFTTYEYDAYGQLIVKTFAGATTRYAYNESGRLTAVTDPLGNTSRLEYDDAGNVTATIDAIGNRTELTYDERGKLLSVKDPLGNVSSRSYDEAGRLAKATDPLGRATRMETDYHGQLTAVIDALNHRREFVYEADGNLIKTIDGEAVTLMDYDIRGRLVAVTDPEGNTTRYEYADGGCSSCGGDASQPKKIIDPFGNAIENLFDKNGRIVGIQDPLQNLNSLTYDARGQVLRRIDANGNVTTYKYDALGRVISQTDANGGVTAFTYDQRGNLASLTDPEGHTTRFEHDLAGRKIRETRPMGQVTEYTYYPNGLLKTVRDPKWQVTTYTYDAAGRLTEVLYADGKKDTFAYDAVGNLTGWSGVEGVSGSMTYDELNRKTSETVNYSGFSKTHSYTYDARGNKATYTSPEGLLHTYAYDKSGRPTAITFAGKTIGFTHDKTRLKQVAFSSGVTTDYTYNANSWLSGINTAGPQGTILSRDYSFDKVGNILTKNSDHGLYTYGYDPTYQLTSADNPQLADEYSTYDKVGNRLTSAETDALWSYNDNNELISDTRAVFEYDTNGNTVKKTEGAQVTTYAYNARNRLEKVYLPDGRVAHYAYDPFGRRLKKQVANEVTYFAYADEGLMGEYDSSGSQKKTYGWKPDGLWGTDPLYMAEGNNIYFYHNDHLGTPQKVTDIRGDVVWSASYKTFGKDMVDPASTVENNLRFPGQYFDDETELGYNYLRNYNGQTGRYIEADPIGLASRDVNYYRYVQNNPCRYGDIYGLTGLTIPFPTEIVIPKPTLTIPRFAPTVPMDFAPLDDSFDDISEDGDNGDKDCNDDCKKLYDEIDRMLNGPKGLKKRYMAMQQDPRQLYTKNYDGKNPEGYGTWVGHQIKYDAIRVGMKRKIEQAKAKGCPIPPGAEDWVNTPPPSRPIYVM